MKYKFLFFNESNIGNKVTNYYPNPYCKYSYFNNNKNILILYLLNKLI